MNKEQMIELLQKAVSEIKEDEASEALRLLREIKALLEQLNAKIPYYITIIPPPQQPWYPTPTISPYPPIIL